MQWPKRFFPDEEIRDVTPEYFSVLKVPLLQGRFFNDGDQFDGPDVTIINSSFAKKWFPNQDAVGKRITFGDPRKPDVKWVTIVGVVGDMSIAARSGAEARILSAAQSATVIAA